MKENPDFRKRVFIDSLYSGSVLWLNFSGNCLIQMMDELNKTKNASFHLRNR